MARHVMAGLALATLGLAVPRADAASAAPAANVPLRLVTTPIAPFVLPNTDPLAGFSVDVWNELARRLHVDFAWQVVAAGLLGVVLIAQLTATVTSSQTVARLQSEIRGPGDLPGKTIAAIPGSIASDYLTRLGLPFVAMANPDDGIRMLTQGEVQAVVLNAAALQYEAAKRGGRLLQVVGPIFRPYKVAIAVKEGSPLRKSINKALLAIYEDGTYEDIHAKWFARGN